MSRRNGPAVDVQELDRVAERVFEVPGEVEVWFDPDLAELLVVWTRFGSRRTLHDCLDAQAVLVETGRATDVVIDVENASGAPSAQDHDYIERFVFPRFRRGGLRAIVTVVPRSGHTRLGIRRWPQHAAKWRFEAFETDSVAAAREFLARRRVERSA